jgi:hypothetical protein
MAPGLEPEGMDNAQMELAGGSGGGGLIAGNGVGGKSDLQSADLLPGRHAGDLRPERLRPEPLREVRSGGRG